MGKLQAVKIDGVIYFCNDKQIAEYGSLEKAGQSLHEKRNPKPKTSKAKKTEEVETAGEQTDSGIETVTE